MERLISDSFRELNAQLHRENPMYGASGAKRAALVAEMVAKAQTQWVLDYGCGKGLLAQNLPFPIAEYDPAIPGKDAKPETADFVVCSDVLEHVEPECLDAVLADLARCVRRYGYFVIDTVPAKKFYADGRNAHLIQESEAWWADRLDKYFNVNQIAPESHELHIIVTPKTPHVAPDPAKIYSGPVKMNPKYCVSHAQRDAQWKLATQRVKARIQPGEKRTDPIAVVGYGPSLNQTWEQIRDYKYIMSMSGSHNFLLNKGIVPTWHVEVDPRPHKVKLMGAPHYGVKYLIASDCHPALFDHLEGFDVTLWHVFAQEQAVMEYLTPGEWAFTGGSGVGVRAMILARFLGFRNMDIFGMDGCFGETGQHAAAHPNQRHDENIKYEYNGKVYETSTGFLYCARETFDTIDVLPNCQVRFFGEGLVQAMAKDHVQKVWEKDHFPIIALQKQVDDVVAA